MDNIWTLCNHNQCKYIVLLKHSFSIKPLILLACIKVSIYYTTYNPLRNGCEISKIMNVKSRLGGVQNPVSLDFLVRGGVWGQNKLEKQKMIYEYYVKWLES